MTIHEIANTYGAELTGGAPTDGSSPDTEVTVATMPLSRARALVAAARAAGHEACEVTEGAPRGECWVYITPAAS